MAAPAQAYSSRHTGSIADLIRRGGDIQADTTARRGAISGQMWQGIGEGVGGFLSQLADENWHGAERKRQQEAQAERDRLTTESAQLDLQARKDKAAAVTKESNIQQQIGVYRARAMKQQADGTWALDLSNLRGQMEQAGLGDRMDEIEQGYLAIQKDTVALENLRRQRADLEDAAFSKMGRMIQSMGNTPEAFSAAVAHVTQNGMLSDDKVKVYVEQADKDPEAIGRIAAGLAALGDKGSLPQAKTPEKGSFAAIVQGEEAALGRPLTTKEALALRTEYEKAGWKPERPRGSGGSDEAPGLTPAQVGRNKTWKADRLSDLEKAKDRELATAVEEYNKRLGRAVDTNNPQDPAVQDARKFIDAAKADIYGRLEKSKQRVYTDFEDMMGGPGPAPAGAPIQATAPPPAPAAGRTYQSTYQSPGVESIATAPKKYAGRVIARAKVEDMARRYGISYEEAKSRAEQTFGVTVR